MIIALCAICVMLTPNTIKVEELHISSASQHFGNHPTNNGANISQVVAAWQLPYHAYLELGQGYCTEGCAWQVKFSTTIRVGVQWELK